MVERTKRLLSLVPHLAEDEPPLFTRQIHSSELAVFRWKFKLDLDFSYFRAGPYVTDSVSMQCVQLRAPFLHHQIQNHVGTSRARADQ